MFERDDGPWGHSEPLHGAEYFQWDGKERDRYVICKPAPNGATDFQAFDRAGRRFSYTVWPDGRVTGPAVDALTKAAQDHVGQLTNLARRILHDDHFAEDAVQDALLNALRRMHELAPGAKPIACLHERVKHVALNLRKRIVRTTEALDESLEDQQLGPEGQMISSEQLGTLMATIARLPEASRVAVTLFFVEELTKEEIGEGLGITRNALGVRLSRAVKHLARLLPPELRELIS